MLERFYGAKEQVIEIETSLVMEMNAYFNIIILYNHIILSISRKYNESKLGK